MQRRHRNGSALQEIATLDGLPHTDLFVVGIADYAFGFHCRYLLQLSHPHLVNNMAYSLIFNVI